MTLKYREGFARTKKHKGVHYAYIWSDYWEYLNEQEPEYGTTQLFPFSENDLKDLIDEAQSGDK